MDIRIECVDEPEQVGKLTVDLNYTAEAAMLKLATTDLDNELGGVLVGKVDLDNGRTKVHILALIEAKYTETSRTQVKFTNETWADVNRIMDEQYPDQRIVGWFHTHPGFGVFLSQWDLFVHKHFFSTHWQVACVVDQIDGRLAIFGWDKGKIVELSSKRVKAVRGAYRPTNIQIRFAKEDRFGLNALIVQPGGWFRRFYGWMCPKPKELK